MIIADILGIAGLGGALIGKIENISDLIIFCLCALYCAIRVVFGALMKYERWQLARFERKQRMKKSL